MIKKNTIISLLLGLIVAFSGCASVQKSKKITDVAKVEYQTVNTYTGNEEHTPETEIDEISEKYLYNRCHLIGYQLSAENVNISNLITGTRYLNTEGMLPFENMVADYVKETNNHVLYRVTPIFENDNLLATGVLMEAYSVEDDGTGVCYNVYCYNVQPGITINYATGESEAEDGSLPYGSSATITNSVQNNDASEITYIGNKNTKKFHYSHCNSVTQMKESNKEYFSTLREYVIRQGYKSCARCCP